MSRQKGITRRQFLRASALTGLGLLVPLKTELTHAAAPHTPRLVAAAQPLNPAVLSKYTEQLPWLLDPALTVDLTKGGTFSGAMAQGLHQFHSQLAAAPAWGYAGAAYLGPTFVVRRGVPVTINWTNKLGRHLLDYAIDTNLHGAVQNDKTKPRTAVHLHGGHVAPGSDGGPTQTFLPNKKYQYNYVNDQEASTLWYHDHALGITRLNVYAGLAGYYLVRDDWDTGREDNGPGLPTGKYEVPIVIQDRMLTAAGSLHYPVQVAGVQPPVPPIWTPEFFGDIAVVNGKVWPNLNVDQGWYRFRLLNGSNSRVYNLKLSTGQPIFQIGTDGGLLNAPVPLGQLLIAPGERADVLINFSELASGTKVLLTNNAPTPFPNGPRNARRGGAPIKQIMQFTVANSPGFTEPIPSKLRQTLIQPLTAPVKVRNLTLVEVLDPATGAPVKALLNNLPWHSPVEQWEQPQINTVEQWNIINTTGDTHPIHLHLVQFQILGRQKFDVAAYMAAFNQTLPAPGLPDPAAMELGPWPSPSADGYTIGAPMGPALNEAGWKDTVRANPGEITRILVPFGGTAAGLNAAYTKSFTGEYVWHCHILEHEDHEMMLPYRVVG